MARFLGSRIIGYGCTTSAGPGVGALWRALSEGVDLSTPCSIGADDSRAVVRGCFFPARAGGTLDARTLLRNELLAAWKECQAGVERAGRLGVILASTKGLVDDRIWQDATPQESWEDPATPVLEDFMQAASLSPLLSVCVSNACASSLGALWLAREWLTQKRVDDVLILACDLAGRFVLSGFQALGALSPERSRPFSAVRSGLQLGEATAAIYLSAREVPGHPQLLGIALDAEGYAVTRPSSSGESLSRACQQALGEWDAHLVIAHGTATRANDEAEDRALASISNLRGVPITGSKWCVGHTLGASGALDLIAACEVLKKGRAFTLANTAHADPTFTGRYLCHGQDVALPEASRVLVSSLGFGGIHAAALIGLPS